MKKDVAKRIDHTILKPAATEADVIKLCDEALKYGFASICINPYFVPLVADKLKNSDVKTCTVVGFPLGANPTAVKAFEAEWAVRAGAEEVDMVINIGAVKKGDYTFVEEDVKTVVEASQKANKAVVVKVIIETCLLTENEKEKVITLLLNTGADFVKTSTGFSTGGATVEDIAQMKRIVGDKMLIKASGGIKNYSDYKKMVAAGADRIGTSSGIAIVEEI